MTDGPFLDADEVPDPDEFICIRRGRLDDCLDTVREGAGAFPSVEFEAGVVHGSEQLHRFIIEFADDDLTE